MTFITQYTSSKATNSFGDELNTNLTQIQTELNDVKNIAYNVIDTDAIQDDAVNGDNIKLDSVLNNYDMASVAYLDNKVVIVDSSPPVIYDVNYVLGQIIGDDDLIWDSDNWANTGNSTPTWADAPAFEMTLESPADNPDQWRSWVYAVWHPGVMRFSIKYQDENMFAALLVGYPDGTLLPSGEFDDEKISDFLDFVNNNGLADYVTSYTEDKTSYNGAIWSTLKSGTDYIQFSPAFIQQLADDVTGSNSRQEIDITVPIAAEEGEPAFICLIVFKATYGSASTTFETISTETLEISQVRYMPIGQPGENETLIEVAAKYYTAEQAFVTGDYIWYNDYIYQAIQDTTGNAPTGAATSNSYWTYKTTIGA